MGSIFLPQFVADLAQWQEGTSKSFVQMSFDGSRIMYQNKQVYTQYPGFGRDIFPVIIFLCVGYWWFGILICVGVLFGGGCLQCFGTITFNGESNRESGEAIYNDNDTKYAQNIEKQYGVVV